MDSERIKLTAQAVAAYLLNKDKTLSIKGPKVKVEKLAKDLTHLKDLIIKTVPDEEREEGKKTKKEYVVAGIIGFILGKDTGIKFKGDKYTTTELAKAINEVKNDLVVKKFKAGEV